MDSVDLAMMSNAEAQDEHKMAAFQADNRDAFPALWAHLHALDMVTVERMWQCSRYWDDQATNDPATWLVVLAEEMGELAQQVLAYRAAEADLLADQRGAAFSTAAVAAISTNMMREAIHVAATGVALVEQLLRAGVVPPAERGEGWGL